MLRPTRITVLALAIAFAGGSALGAGMALGDDKKFSGRSHASHDRHEDHRGRGHDRERHDRDHHDRDRDHRRGHSHHAYRPSYGHGHHHGRRGHRDHHHGSRIKPCGHTGACPTRAVRVCVRAGYYENRYVPAVTQICYDAHGCPYTKVICAARWETVWVPAVYQTRHVSVCEGGHTGFSFSFGF